MTILSASGSFGESNLRVAPGQGIVIERTVTIVAAMVW